jgi:hypothetical protein
VPIGTGNRDARRPIIAPVLFPEHGDERLHARFVLRREHEHWLVEIEMRPRPRHLKGGPHLLELPRNATSRVFVGVCDDGEVGAPDLERGPVSGIRADGQEREHRERKKRRRASHDSLANVDGCNLSFLYLVVGGPGMSALRLVGGVPM